MVDIHTHILWGVDDGAVTKLQSVAMLRTAAQHGTTAIVATPHKDPRFQYDVALVESRIKELQEEVPELEIYRGCDFHLSLENISQALKEPRKYTINGGPYLLVEFADTFIPPTADNIFREFLAGGVIPVITHPERNPILRESQARLKSWVEMGCLLQVTAQALTDTFGRNVRTAAWRLLKANLVQVIASDAHDTEYRPPRLDEARRAITNEAGAEMAGLLLEDNPAAMVEGQSIERRMPSTATSRGWGFRR